MEKVALIDADSLLYYEMGKPTLEEAMESIDIRIEQILNFAGTTKYRGFLTLGKCFRYDIAKTKPYKYNRKGGTPKPPIFYALKEYVQQKWGFYAVKGLEADDLVAIYQDENTVICSPDKDVLKQLAGKHFNYGKMEFVTTSHNDAYNFLCMQVLMGDSTDGIPGIPKVGPKTAEKWIEEVGENNDKLTMALKKYIEKFNIQEGIHKFAETFNLVYLIRSSEEAQKIGIKELPLVPIFDSVEDKKDEDDSDW